MTSRAPDHLLDQTIAIQRGTTTVDADGSPVVAWATHLASIKARLRPVRPRRTTDADRVTARRLWMIYVDAGHDILATDRVIYGNTILRVTGILDHGTSGTVQALNAEELHQ